MTGSLFVLTIVLIVSGLSLIMVWARDERRRYEAESARQRKLISELQRHLSSAGTEFCPYCRERVSRCLCDWPVGK